MYLHLVPGQVLSAVDGPAAQGGAELLGLPAEGDLHQAHAGVSAHAGDTGGTFHCPARVQLEIVSQTTLG